ncbi:hypothetical protein B0H12DRAFT_596709 [Mycena haematopus]|nr:hypothetical protein B0H12DRAFT_596709 [Mycena haematopus]
MTRRLSVPMSEHTVMGRLSSSAGQLMERLYLLASEWAPIPLLFRSINLRSASLCKVLSADPGSPNVPQFDIYHTSVFWTSRTIFYDKETSLYQVSAEISFLGVVRVIVWIYCGDSNFLDALSSRSGNELSRCSRTNSSAEDTEKSHKRVSPSAVLHHKSQNKSFCT